MPLLSTLGLTSVSAGLAMATYGVLVEPRRFHLRHWTIRPKRRPPAPFRVLHVSDSHFMANQRMKEQFLQSLAAYPLDFVFLCGDLIETDSGIEPLVTSLQALRPKYGVFCVLAAHDFLFPGAPAIARDLLFGGRHHTMRNDGKLLIRSLRDAGVRVFRNDGFVLEPGETSPFPEPVYLAGINDAFSNWHNVERAFRRYSPDMWSMLLTHALHEYNDVIEAGPDLCVGGHSHGGQVRIPGIGAVLTRCSLKTEYARGTHRLGRTEFHLNHGLGCGAWTHVRFNCRPEATILDVQ